MRTNLMWLLISKSRNNRSKNNSIILKKSQNEVEFLHDDVVFLYI